jgi:transposase
MDDNQFKNDRAKAVNSEWLLGEGKCCAQIATAIGISFKTVANSYTQGEAWGKQPLIPFGGEPTQLRWSRSGPACTLQTLRVI